MTRMNYWVKLALGTVVMCLVMTAFQRQYGADRAMWIVIFIGFCLDSISGERPFAETAKTWALVAFLTAVFTWIGANWKELNPSRWGGPQWLGVWVVIMLLAWWVDRACERAGVRGSKEDA